MECDIKNTTIKNIPQHERSKKHKYFSNLVLNWYFVKDLAVDKVEDNITLHYNEHRKKLHSFCVVIYWDIDDETKYKISIPNRILFGSDVYV